MKIFPAAKATYATLISLALIQPAHSTLLAIDFSGALYSLSATTAAATLIGNTGVAQTGSLEFSPGGVLYTHTAGANPVLYTVNPKSAAAAAVGGLGIDADFEGAIAFSPSGTAYATNSGSSANAQLLILNLGTGAATVVGSMNGTAPDLDINGLAWRGDGNLIGLDRGTASLVLIDPITAAVTALAAVPGGVGDIGGMAVLDGIGYYATASGGVDELHSFDLFSGTSTFIGAITGMGDVAGLAAVSSVAPVPGTAALLALGLVAGALGRRRQDRPIGERVAAAPAGHA